MLKACELDELRGYIKLRKELAPIINAGVFHRLWSPFEGQYAAWMFVAEDKREALVFAFVLSKNAGEMLPRLRLKGLGESRLDLASHLSLALSHLQSLTVSR